MSYLRPCGSLRLSAFGSEMRRSASSRCTDFLPPRKFFGRKQHLLQIVGAAPKLNVKIFVSRNQSAPREMDRRSRVHMRSQRQAVAGDPGTPKVNKTEFSGVIKYSKKVDRRYVRTPFPSQLPSRGASARHWRPAVAGIPSRTVVESASSESVLARHGKNVDRKRQRLHSVASACRSDVKIFRKLWRRLPERSVGGPFARTRASRQAIHEDLWTR
jgi:hypothetical protein